MENESFRIKINNYFFLLEKAVFDPDLYSKTIKNSNLNQGLIFFGINSFLWLITLSLIRTFQIEKYNLFFAVLSENLLLIPIILISLFCLAVILYILAKLLGSRAKFINNLKGVLFSTILFPFFAVPVFKILAVIISIYILIYCFKSINRFNKIKAVISIFVPIGILIFALYSIGIINNNLITR